MSDDTEQAAKQLAFLLELRELSRKHGIAIGGCGCCGSPWLDMGADVSDERAGYMKDHEGLRWIAPSDDFYWREYSAQIVAPKHDPLTHGMNSGDLMAAMMRDGNGA